MKRGRHHRCADHPLRCRSSERPAGRLVLWRDPPRQPALVRGTRAGRRPVLMKVPAAPPVVRAHRRGYTTTGRARRSST
jgi:hypothetical protein